MGIYTNNALKKTVDLLRISKRSFSTRKQVNINNKTCLNENRRDSLGESLPAQPKTFNPKCKVEQLAKDCPNCHKK